MGSAPTQTLHDPPAASDGTGGRSGGAGVGLMSERGRAVGAATVGRAAGAGTTSPSRGGPAKGPLPDEDFRTTPTTSSSSDAGFEDEVVLVPTSSLSSTRQHAIPLTTPAAFRPFSSLTSSQDAEDDSGAHKPVEGVFATHRRWTNGGKDRDRAEMSEKARGKLPASTADKVATVDRRRKSLDAIARGGSIFDGVEIEVPARRKSRLHMRWTSGDSEADVTLDRFAASSTGSATSPKAGGARLSPPVIEDSASPPTRRSSSSSETLVVSTHHPSAGKPRDHSTSSEPAKQLPSPSPSTSLPEKRRSPSTSSAASSSRTKHSFELIIDQPSRPRAPPKPTRTPLRFPNKPASHPLNLLRTRSHPTDSAPPPPLAVRFVRNPHFAPAQELGWIEGKGPHVEVKKRMGPVERAVAAASVSVSREQSPLVSAEGTPGPGGGRRSTRVPVQARPPSMIYPSAIERLASSAKRSRSPSSQLPTPPPSTSLPLPRRPPLSTVLRKRYDWLHPRSRGPFRIDGSALGTDPTLLGYEWDEDELDEERWAGGEWDEDEDGDMGVRTGRYGGPYHVAQAAEAARRALFSPPNSSSSNASSSAVKVALDVKPWAVVPWAWKDLDVAKGCAGPGGTAGWATRDPWMHYLFDSSDSDEAASLSVVETLSSPVAHHSPRRVLAAAASGSSSSPPAQVGAKITAVPPSTSSPAVTRTVETTSSEEDAVASSSVHREDAQQAGTLTSPIIIDSTTCSSASSSRDPSPVLVATANRRVATTRVDSSPDPLDQLSGSSTASPAASSSRQQLAVSPTNTSASSGSASSSSRDIQPIAGPSNPRKRPFSPPLPSTTASSTSHPSASTSAASASASSVSPPAKPVVAPSRQRTRHASRRIVSATTSTASTSTSTSSVSPPPKKAPPAPRPPPASKKRKVEDKPVAKPKKPPTPPLVPKRPNLKRPSSSPEGSSAALKRRKKEPTPEGFVRCAHPGCPSPFYPSKAASSAGNHAQNYHGSSTTISWRDPDRSGQLTRSKKTGAFECEYCGFWSMNAASTKQHTYVRKGRICPGPPHGAR
ncbi:hypothetical protein JCM10296v2_000880 [Rhodotorula toruloides]